MNYRNYVKSYKDFPKEGILFWDFTYLLKNVEARNKALSEMIEFVKDKKIVKVVAVESKGFTIGSMLADRLNIPLVLVRKPNLIPGEYYSEKFIKEYGMGEYQIKKDAIENGEKVVVVYDIMAGSGASKAAINLINKCGGLVEDIIYVTELEYLKGREDLSKYNIFSLLKVSEKND